MSKVFDNIQSKRNIDAPSQWTTITSIEMHTCGEPLRVLMDGLPDLKGDSVLAKRRDLMENHDHIRTSTMFEPRGHADMYGCILVEPENETSDFGIIFLHNEGYSTMCGHAIIAITTLAVQMNWINVKEGNNTLKIDAPCGMIESNALIENDKIQNVSFKCVPSFVQDLDLVIDTPSYGKVKYDLAYGGAYYAYVDLQKNDLDFNLSEEYYSQIISAGKEIKLSITNSGLSIKHPFEADLSFLYGTIFIGPSSKQGIHSQNVCVFADGEVDRSPTGSGLSGRLAIHKRRNEINLKEQIEVESIIGTSFKGQVLEDIQFGLFDAVIPLVSGSAHITGANQFYLNSDDPLNHGFFLR